MLDTPLAASSSRTSKTRVEATHTLPGGLQLPSAAARARTGSTNVPTFTQGFANLLTSYLCYPCVWQSSKVLEGAR